MVTGGIFLDSLAILANCWFGTGLSGESCTSDDGTSVNNCSIAVLSSLGSSTFNGLMLGVGLLS